MSLFAHFKVMPSLDLLVPRAERGRLIGLLLLTLLMAILELALALLVALLAKAISGEAIATASGVSTLLQTYTQSLFGTSANAFILGSLLALMLTLLGRSVLQLFYQWQLTQYAERVGGQTRARIFRFYQRAPYLWVSDEGIAELQFNVAASTSVSAVLAQALHFTAHTVMIGVLIIGLACFAPSLSVVIMTLFVGLGSGLIVMVKRALDRSSNTVLDQELRLAQLAHHALHGLKEMRLTQRENHLFTQYTQGLQRFMTAKSYQQLFSSLPAASLEVLGFAALFITAIYLVYIEEINTTELSSTLGFIAAVAWRGLPMINRVLRGYSAMRSHRPYIERVIKIIKLEESLAPHLLQLDHQSTPPTFIFSQDISAAQLSFRYPNTKEWVLNELNFSIKCGETLGLVGVSGAGKSTLAQLLVGLISANKGNVLIDEHELTPIRLQSWLSQVGYVSQNPYLFDLTLAENIALASYGTPINDQRVLECCELAMVDFIDDLKQGVDSVLGEDGIKLSGGQAQRVALARALYHQPRVLIVDEATNALDAHHEQEVMTRLKRSSNSLTLIMITHHLASLEQCDRVIWLNQGRIHQQGDAQEVLKHYRAYLDDLSVNESSL